MIAAESLPGLADLKAALIDDQPRCVIFPVLIPPRPISCLNRRGSGSTLRFDYLGIEILQSGKVGKRPCNWQLGELRNRLLAQLSSLVDFRRNEMPIQLPSPMTSPAGAATIVVTSVSSTGTVAQNQMVFRSSIEEIERQTNAYFVVRSDDPVWQSIMSLKTISIDALPQLLIDLLVHMSGYVPRLKRHQSEGGSQHYSLVSPF